MILISKSIDKNKANHFSLFSVINYSIFVYLFAVSSSLESSYFATFRRGVRRFGSSIENVWRQANVHINRWWGAKFFPITKWVCRCRNILLGFEYKCHYTDSHWVTHSSFTIAKWRFGHSTSCDRCTRWSIESGCTAESSQQKSSARFVRTRKWNCKSWQRRFLGTGYHQRGSD